MASRTNPQSPVPSPQSPLSLSLPPGKTNAEPHHGTTPAAPVDDDGLHARHDGVPDPLLPDRPVLGGPARDGGGGGGRHRRESELHRARAHADARRRDDDGG